MPAGERASVGPTMRDVARETGVSKALVSIVFRGVPGASPANDTPLARLRSIDLTSVRQEAAELARMAVTAAVERLDQGRRRGRDTVLIPRLVIRGSSAP